MINHDRLTIIRRKVKGSLLSGSFNVTKSYIDAQRMFI